MAAPRYPSAAEVADVSRTFAAANVSGAGGSSGGGGDAGGASCDQCGTVGAKVSPK